MSTFTSFAGQLNADITGATIPAVAQIDMSTAATEYSYVLPANCRQFLIKLQSAALLKISYMAGQSGTTYLTIPRHCFYAESDLKPTSTLTLYFQSDTASQVAEIVTWT